LLIRRSDEEGGDIGQELVDMVNDGIGSELPHPFGAQPKLTRIEGTRARLAMSTLLSPTMMARDGTPPASVIT